MVNISSLKKGFTLVEALTSMLIISIFFAIMSKTIISKPKTVEKPEHHHGFYECYNMDAYSDGMESDSTLSEDEEAECTFKPVPGTAFAVIYTFNGKDYINETTNNRINISDTNQREIKVYKRDLLQFTADEIYIPKGDLGKVPEYYLNMTKEEMENAELTYWDFLNLVKDNYEQQSILFKRPGMNWYGPGIFIIW